MDLYILVYIFLCFIDANKSFIFDGFYIFLTFENVKILNHPESGVVKVDIIWM